MLIDSNGKRVGVYTEQEIRSEVDKFELWLRDKIERGGDDEPYYPNTYIINMARKLDKQLEENKRLREKLVKYLI